MPAELDQLNPNYLTVNPDGSIGAAFTGVINAAGLIIAAGAGAGPPAINRASWQRSSDGKQVASLAGWDAGAGAHLDMLALDPDSAPLSSTGITAYSGSAAGGSEVDVSAGDATGTAGARLLDSAGRSTFLQLLSAQQLQLAEGSGACTFAGGTIDSGQTTIAHGLGRTPRRVSLTQINSASFFRCVVTLNNRDATNIYVGATAVDGTPGASSQVVFDWIAIG